jgi:hypothetical protein
VRSGRAATAARARRRAGAWVGSDPVRRPDCALGSDPI